MNRRVLAGMLGLALAGCRSTGPGLAQSDGTIPVPGRGPIRGQSPPVGLTSIPPVRDAINNGQPAPEGPATSVRATGRTRPDVPPVTLATYTPITEAINAGPETVTVSQVPAPTPAPSPKPVLVAAVPTP